MQDYLAFCVFPQSQVLDFGKIIIYTSNLRIIRAPQRKPEALRHHAVPHVDLEGYPKARERGSRRRAKATCAQDGEEREEKQLSNTEAKVMVLSQIILSGVVEFLSPPFSVSFSSFALSSLSFSTCLQPSFLHIVFASNSLTAGSLVQLYSCNLQLFTEGFLFSSGNLLCVSL